MIAGDQAAPARRADPLQAARDYPQYTENLSRVGAAELAYVGMALAGSKKAVDRLTGSLPLFR